MSLINFENITQDLKQKEIDIALEIFYRIRKHHVGKNNAVKSSRIVKSYNEKNDLKLTGVKIRKMINWLRSGGLVVCGSEKGYYYPENKTDLQKSIKSLTQRVNQIQRSIKGLETALEKWVE